MAESIVQSVRALSERLQAVEKSAPVASVKIEADVRALLQKEIAALEVRVQQVAQDAKARPVPTPTPDMVPAVQALEKRLSEQSQGIEKRLTAQEEALEQIRQKWVAPPSTPNTPPVLKIAAEPDAPKPSVISESAEKLLEAKEPEMPLTLPDEPTPGPSLWTRFWRYLNAPAFGKESEAGHD